MLVDAQIEERAGRNWGLARVYRWAKGKDKHKGETVLLSQILRVARTYSTRSVERVIRNEFEEKIDVQTRRWLYSLTRNENE